MPRGETVWTTTGGGYREASITGTDYCCPSPLVDGTRSRFEQRPRARFGRLLGGARARSLS
ncbi:MAG: hypothetical protein R3B99_29030 [Polyangiales bacterium]|nr:hypothetical protein [Sandaracinus sp.]